MTFSVAKILAVFAYPLSQVLLGLMLGIVLLWRRRRRAALITLAATLAWLWLAASLPFGAMLMGRLEATYPPLPATELPTADVIVLLGGAVNARATPGVLGDLNRWSDRLVFATALYKSGKAPHILVTGGGPRGEPTEAALMADILQTMGVPEAALILEQQSRTTFDNARFVAPMLQDMGAQRVLLVTSAFHMRRSMALFRAQGVTPVPAATDHQVISTAVPALRWIPSLAGLTLTHYAIHERIGYLVYRWRGWL